MIKKFKHFLNEEQERSGLSSIRPGSIVRYDGTAYYVIYSDDFILELSKDPDAIPGDRNNLLVNAAMFSEKGFIS